LWDIVKRPPRSEVIKARKYLLLSSLLKRSENKKRYIGKIAYARYSGDPLTNISENL